MLDKCWLDDSLNILNQWLFVANLGDESGINEDYKWTFTTWGCSGKNTKDLLRSFPFEFGNRVYQNVFRNKIWKFIGSRKHGLMFSVFLLKNN